MKKEIKPLKIKTLENFIEKLPVRISIPNGKMATIFTKSGKKIKMERSDVYALVIHSAPLENIKWQVFYRGVLEIEI